MIFLLRFGEPFTILGNIKKVGNLVNIKPNYRFIVDFGCFNQRGGVSGNFPFAVKISIV